MKVASGRSIKQRKHRALEGLNLPLSLRIGRVWGTQNTQPRNFASEQVVLVIKAGDLDCEPIAEVPQSGVLGCNLIILGRENSDLLLDEPGSGLGLVPLLLAELHPVTPHTGSGILSRVTHADLVSSHALRLHGDQDRRMVAAVRHRSRSSRRSERRPLSASKEALSASMVVL